jgi:hypothetical protein
VRIVRRKNFMAKGLSAKYSKQTGYGWLCEASGLWPMSWIATPCQCGENPPLEEMVCVEVCHEPIVRQARIILCKTAGRNLDRAARAYLTVIARHPQAGVRAPAS